ncbi:MAG: HepT-like ribonuclease domain-containing protein [Candidatus Omnitrophota bacterium]
MYDKELAEEILQQVHRAIEIILGRFDSIETVNDFTDTPEGMEKLDSVCMQLIVIGEGLKNFDKVTDNSILCRYPRIEWKKVKGMRDIITHHYIDINAEAIYAICEDKLPALRSTIKAVLKGIQQNI